MLNDEIILDLIKHNAKPAGRALGTEAKSVEDAKDKFEKGSFHAASDLKL